MRQRSFISVLLLLLAASVPAGAATLFGLVDTGELYASTDGGAHWSILSTLPVHDATAIAAAETSDRLFLATESGLLYRSADGGLNWMAVGTVSAENVVDMMIHSNGDIFLLTATGEIFLSANDGASFSLLATLTASNHVSLDGDEGGGDNLYALTRTGEVARSADEGSTWDVVGAVATPEAVDIQSLGLEMYVLTATGLIYRSTDQAVTWVAVGTVSQVHMTGITRNDNTWIATTAEGLVAASTDATSWSFVGSINQLTVIAIGNDSPQATGIGPDRPPVPAGLRLDPPWPNPLGVSGNVNITFELSGPGTLSLQLFNPLGQLVTQRPEQFFPSAGDHNIEWAMPSFASGVYFVRATSGNGLFAQQKLVIVR